MTKKAENVIAPSFFVGGLSKIGQKCLTMRRKGELATMAKEGLERKGAKILNHVAKRRVCDDGEGGDMTERAENA